MSNRKLEGGYVPTNSRTTHPRSAKGHSGEGASQQLTPAQHDQAFLHAKGWRERICAGPWRWYRAEWKPLAYYTLHDAVSLERTRSKQVQPGGRR